MSVTTLERPKDNKTLAFLANAKEATAPDAPGTPEEKLNPKSKAKVESSSPHKRRIDGNIVITRDGGEEEYTADGRKLTETEKARNKASRGGQLTNEEKLAQMSGLNIAKEGTSVGNASSNSAASIAAQARHDSQTSAFSRILTTGSNILTKAYEKYCPPIIKGAIKAIGDGATAIGTAIVDGAKKAGTAILDGAKKIGGAVVDGAKAAGTAIVGFVQDPVGSVKAGVAKVGQAAGAAYDKYAPQVVKNGVTAVANAGRSARDTVVGWKDNAVAWMTGDKEEPKTQNAAAPKPQVAPTAKPAAERHALVGEKHDVKPAKKDEGLAGKFAAAVSNIDLNPFDNKPAAAPRPAPKAGATARF